MGNNRVFAMQLNPEGDRRDVNHILREGGLEENPDRIARIFDETFSVAGSDHDLLVLSGSALTISEDVPDRERERTEVAAYHAIGAAEDPENPARVLAVCYGAQAIAKELWPGSIQPTAEWNVGRTVIEFTQDIPGVANIGDRFPISVSYKDEIRIPDEYVIARCIQTGRPLAYKYGNIIGILAHPEIPRNIIEMVIEARADDPRYTQVNRMEVSEEDEANMPSSTVLLNRILI